MSASVCIEYSTKKMGPIASVTTAKPKNNASIC